MKPINEMNLAELAELFDDEERIACRLRELHDLTRWIPVEERLPTESDGEPLLGKVLWMDAHGYIEAQNYAQKPDWALRWQRITPPEAQP